MDLGALGFVPVASAAIGAGATYAWQSLGNRRTEKAVRIQVNAHLLEITALVGNVYRSKWFPEDLVPTMQRLVAASDNMEVALAFRNTPDALWRLGQIRNQCDHIVALSGKRLAANATDQAMIERLRVSLLMYAGTVLTIALQTFTDERIRSLAVKVAADYGFSVEEHKKLVEAHTAAAAFGPTF